MNIPQGGDKPTAYRVADRHGMIFLFLPTPRKAKGTRGHHPKNAYATWRSPKRLLRRQLIKAGVILRSGRSWVKYKKSAQKAYRQYKQDETMGGLLEPNQNSA